MILQPGSMLVSTVFIATIHTSVNSAERVKQQRCTHTSVCHIDWVYGPCTGHCMDAPRSQTLRIRSSFIVVVLAGAIFVPLLAPATSSAQQLHYHVSRWRQSVSAGAGVYRGSAGPRRNACHPAQRGDSHFGKREPPVCCAAM